ncbi:hypothetical protein MTO96_043950, partial [Rhipicephalus appendiculatus]
SSIDSMALLPPLQRPDLRGIAKSRQPSGGSSPSGTRSLVRPRQVPRSPRRLPPSATIPSRNPEEPGPSQASVAGSPPLRSPLSPSRYDKSQLIQMALLRQVEVSPQGLTFTVPRKRTIFEESAETEPDPADECQSRQNETAGSGQDINFPLFGAVSSSDTPEED